MARKITCVSHLSRFYLYISEQATQAAPTACRVRRAIFTSLPMKPKALYVQLLLTIALALTAPSVRAQDGLEGALPRAIFASPLNLTAPFGRTLAVADFDNDHKPDGAVLVDSGRLRGQNSFRIELHLSGSNNTELTFESTETTLAITAWDINKDGATDVIVERSLTHQRLYVWLNDGHGSFHKGRIEDFPSVRSATGERLESPSPQSDCPAVCLGPQRGSEIGILIVCGFSSRPFAAGEQAVSVASAAGSRAVAPNSPRAPPLSHSL